MYVKRNYGFWMTLKWSKMPLIIGLIYAGVICAINYLTPIHAALPWEPLSVIGIAVAFYLGFKNNSSYDRTWEARKIWGAIVNHSRSFASLVTSYVQGEDSEALKQELVYRHIAWMITLRSQLRLAKEWEHKYARIDDMYHPNVCEDYYKRLEMEIIKYIPKKRIEELQTKKNGATQLMAEQAQRLQELKDKGHFDDFRHMQLSELIIHLYDDQGKAERIKNFPFPRQYASTALWLSVVFAAIIPFGMMSVFEEHTWQNMIICPALSGFIIWVFFLMERIGDFSENPFEGTFNDVPITSICRGIEIDLLEILGEDDIPEPIEPINGFLL